MHSVVFGGKAAASATDETAVTAYWETTISGDTVLFIEYRAFPSMQLSVYCNKQLPPSKVFKYLHKTQTFLLNHNPNLTNFGLVGNKATYSIVIKLSVQYMQCHANICNILSFFVGYLSRSNEPISS